MKRFSVEISEVLSRTIEVEAENEVEALKEAKRLYDDCEVVLDADDFVDNKFEVLEEC